MFKKTLYFLVGTALSLALVPVAQANEEANKEAPTQQEQAQETEAQEAQPLEPKIIQIRLSAQQQAQILEVLKNQGLSDEEAQAVMDELTKGVVEAPLGTIEQIKQSVQQAVELGANKTSDIIEKTDEVIEKSRDEIDDLFHKESDARLTDRQRVRSLSIPYAVGTGGAIAGLIIKVPSLNPAKKASFLRRAMSRTGGLVLGLSLGYLLLVIADDVSAYAVDVTQPLPAPPARHSDIPVFLIKRTILDDMYKATFAK